MSHYLRPFGLALLTSFLLAADALAEPETATGPEELKWIAGPWVWTPTRLPDSRHEVTFTPFTETRTHYTWPRHGPRQLARLHSGTRTRPTGDFRLDSAEGTSLTFSGIYRRQGDNRYAREDLRPKDYYRGLVLEWRGPGFTVADTDLTPIKLYVGSTLLPLEEAPLFSALRRGDRAWIAAQPDLAARVMTERDTLGRSLLYRAAQLNDRETITLFLSMGIPADLPNALPLQRTALAAAIRPGNLEVIDQLLAAKADPNLPDARGARPLHIVGQGTKAYREVVRRLLAAGANPALADNAGRTPRERLERAGAKGWLPILDQEIAASESR